ncbi:hypothetical protein [Brunnivagina elsteri]|uniref:Uncharacterized protein n=1 Tax=Brunnivagina elsteri CCALA 953 TaxID=987040 RepID=A0A2A2TL63_9CYAN|nr:hypothetical protein [Calothrix elsteri]PAX58341.1 hypothetical protein CK510_07925 [Calothrix elsteri CCALA 953]
MLSNCDAKKYFEIHYERLISDSAWYRLKRILRECELELSTDNLRFLAEIKQKKQYTKLSLKDLIFCQKQAQEIAKKRLLITGELAYRELQKASQNKAHRTTILRWFQTHVSAINGKYFDKNRNYQAEELIPVFASAYVYAAKKSAVKLSRNKTRSPNEKPH